MSRSALRRTRLAAVAVFALTAVGAGAFAPANAGDCIRVSVWIYKSQQGREYIVERKCIVETPWNNGRHVLHEDGTNWLPPGTPSGAGVEYWGP